MYVELKDVLHKTVFLRYYKRRGRVKEKFLFK